MDNQRRLMVLASASPRRRELLGVAGFMFSTVKVDTDESPLPGELPADYVRRVSAAKAQAALPKVQGSPIILGADTAVVDEGVILGKPINGADAERMLRQLRGGTHQVLTGITLLDSATGQVEQEVCTTDVPMRNYSDEEMMAYIASGDPFDKAGGYAIQSESFHPVETRTGCYANVVGLPLCHLLRALWRMGIPVEQDVPYLCQRAHDYECGVFSAILRL